MVCQSVLWFFFVCRYGILHVDDVFLVIIVMLVFWLTSLMVAMVEEIEIPSFRHFQVDDNGSTDNQEQQTHFFELLIGMENTDAYNRENDSY